MNSSYRRFAFRRLISFVPVVFLLALLIGLLVTPLYADTIVTTTNDSGPGSLRQAILDANSSPGLDVISFQVTGTITLSSQLEINTGIKIQGPGAENLAVSGGGECRVFHITAGESVDISGISIVSGSENYGGAIFNLSDGLTLNDCNFSANNAIYIGGGIYNSGCNPTITNCTFNSNKAQNAGGMYNDYSSPEVTNCTFSSNTGTMSGGGMYNYGGSSTPTVTNCTFSANNAMYVGGGMYNASKSSPTVTNCTFSSNNADIGGGICNIDYCNPNVTNCTFYCNRAYDWGGGMYNSFMSSPIMTNCTFSSNNAGIGGGMYNEGYSAPIVTNSIFWHDTGGEISNYDSTCTPILSCCIVHSDVYDGNSISGYITSADPVLQDLADNGGPTKTCALGLGSSAIDAGFFDDTVSIDQRGVIRPQGASFDIGAYELKCYTITTICNSGGCILPESADVFEGASMDSYVYPESDYYISGVYVDDKPVSYDEVNCCFTFDNVSADHVISADFQLSASDDDDDVDDITTDDDDNISNRNSDGCNIAALRCIGLLFAIPLMFLSGKMK